MPSLLTLHDGWLWCAAGGAELLPDRQPCPGPAPERCAPCAAAWRPTPGRAMRGLLSLAGAASPLVSPDRLHRLYQRIPDRLRLPVRRGASPVEPAAAAAARNQAMAEAARACSALLAPSRYLAARAEALGLGPVAVVPHGVAPGPPRIGGGPLLSLGTVAWHKGTDRVVRAWRAAFPDGAPPLRLHGPVLEAEAALGHPVGPLLDRARVRAALAEARALVLGSRWAENAPLVVSEARAAGCPVVAPDAGGLPELIEEGRDGLLFPAQDDAALVAALRQVVAAPPGPSRPPPSLADQIQATLQVYRRVLAAAAR